VADLNPGAGLAPAAGSMGRYRLIEWLSFINSELHKGFLPLFAAEATMAVKEFALNRLTKRVDCKDSVNRVLPDFA
jgi:glutathione S-transferase